MTAIVDLDGLGVVNAAHVGERAAFDASLDGIDVDVIVVDGSEAADAEGLFAAFADALGLDDDERPVSWDGLADQLWIALGARQASRAVILLNHAERLAHSSMDDLATIVAVVTDLSRSVATTDAGFPRRLRLSTLLLGEGPGFAG